MLKLSKEYVKRAKIKVCLIDVCNLKVKTLLSIC